MAASKKKKETTTRVKGFHKRFFTNGDGSNTHLFNMLDGAVERLSDIDDDHDSVSSFPYIAEYALVSLKHRKTGQVVTTEIPID